MNTTSNPTAEQERHIAPQEPREVDTRHTDAHDNWDAGGYCNALVVDENGDGDICNYRQPLPAPPTDHEKLIAEATNKLWQYFNPGFAPISEEHPDWEFYREAAALAAQPVLDPVKVAEVIRPYDPDTPEDAARALCEAAKRGELT